MTDAAQDAELAKPVTRTVFFAEFQFASGTQRVSNANQPYTWGGYTWSGLGALGGISAISESESVTSKSVSFTLNAADPAWLAEAVGSVEDYRGLPVKLYFCPLAPEFTLVGTPELCWRGVMDTVAVGIDNDGAGAITLTCETSAYGIKRQQALRVNAAQQRARYPTDSGFDYLTGLIANPQLWISKLFQQQQ